MSSHAPSGSFARPRCLFTGLAALLIILAGALGGGIWRPGDRLRVVVPDSLGAGGCDHTDHQPQAPDKPVGVFREGEIPSGRTSIENLQNLLSLHDPPLPPESPVAPDRQPPLNWSPLHFFDQTQNLPLQRQDPLVAQRGLVQADSTVELSTMLRPGPRIDAVVRVAGHAMVGVQGAGRAESLAVGQINIHGTQTRRSVFDGRGSLVTMNRRAIGEINGIEACGIADRRTTGAVADPIAVDIFDVVTGEFIAGQQVYSEIWRVSGAARVTANDEGLRLVARANGVASVEMMTGGDWVLNPFEGSAVLRDGDLALSGVLAGFDWDLQRSADDVTAFLTQSQLESLLTLEIVPTGLGQPEHDLLYVLSASSEGVGIAVPEPALLVSFGMGAAALLVRRRRRHPAKRR